MTKHKESELQNFIFYAGYDYNNNSKIKVRILDENIWLNQKEIAELFESSKANISEHISNIFSEGELNEISTVRKFRTVQQEGNREVLREIEYYNLDMIISI